jgi:hypothetical protein
VLHGAAGLCSAAGQTVVWCVRKVKTGGGRLFSAELVFRLAKLQLADSCLRI